MERVDYHSSKCSVRCEDGLSDGMSCGWPVMSPRIDTVTLIIKVFLPRVDHQ